jgi:hypothetical protein
MADKPYTVKDRRRIDERGQRREAQTIPGKREIRFKDVRDPLDSAFRYFRAQIERLPGRNWPRSGEVRDLLRGFVISTQQLYEGTILLMADNRPKPLVLPAGVVARALVEGLGNLLAIVEAPESAAAFLKDDYLNTFRKAEYYRERFGNTPAMEKELKNLADYARAMKLTPEEIADPENRLKEWPTPRPLLKRLTGERKQVFEEIYRFWYRSLSALAHHRLTALQVAVFTEEQPSEDTFFMVKSVTAALAVSVALCVLSEVEDFCRLKPNLPLRAVWGQMRDAHDIIAAVYRIRYARLLKMDPPSSSAESGTPPQQ